MEHKIRFEMTSGAKRRSVAMKAERNVVQETNIIGRSLPSACGSTDIRTLLLILRTLFFPDASTASVIPATLGP
jgi:hypothetical protein